MVRAIVLLFSIFLVVQNTYGSEKSLEIEAYNLVLSLFKEGKIKGTGHEFRITAECDADKLKRIADSLPENKLGRVEYSYTLIEVPANKKKNRLVKSGLDPKIEKCILEKYTKDIHYIVYDWMPKETEREIVFPVFLIKNKTPIVPNTPIGFVSSDN